MEYIRILIVDDDPGWIKILTEVLNKEPDFIIVGSALNKSGALALIQADEADMVLMDLNLDGDEEAGIEITNEIQTEKALKVIVVTAYPVEELILKAFSAGAKHFFSKDCLADIPNAIRLSYHDASPVEILLKSYLDKQKELMLMKLSPAEKELLGYIKQGLSISKMAVELQKSENAVKQMINRILKKLNVKRRHDLPRYLL
ncbi:MAG TPA: response regulator transcription factor [Bacillota bacterium]|nr:response regulator transcription factor [Bacillota bacterium]